MQLKTVRLALLPASHVMATAPEETLDGPASSEPVVPDSHHSGIPHTIKSNRDSSEMWHAVNELSIADKNVVTWRSLWLSWALGSPSWSAPDDYDVDAVLREQLQLLHEVAQRQRQRELQPERWNFPLLTSCCLPRLPRENSQGKNRMARGGATLARCQDQ